MALAFFLPVFFLINGAVISISFDGGRGRGRGVACEETTVNCAYPYRQ